MNGRDTIGMCLFLLGLPSWFLAFITLGFAPIIATIHIKEFYAQLYLLSFLGPITMLCVFNFIFWLIDVFFAESAKK